MASKNLRLWTLAQIKGFARIRFMDDDEECQAELHWYEAHGIGKKEMKVKNIFD